jgi:PAS domain S-box-containing protein
VLASGSVSGLANHTALVARDGSIRSIDDSAAPIRDAMGSVVGVVLIFRDITERKRQQREREESAALLETLLDNAPVSFALLDANGRFVRLNERAAVVDGIPKEAHLNKTVSELLPEVGPTIEERIREVIRTGQPILHTEVSGATRASPDEPQYWIASYYPVRTVEGNWIGVGVMALEITERRKIEESLRVSERRLRERATELEAVLRATPTAIWIAHDPQCRNISGNPAACRLLRMPEGSNASATPDQPIRRDYREYRNGVPVPGPELPMQVAASQGVEVQGAELTLVFSDGTARHIFGNAVPLFSPDGSVRGSIAAFMDVTELKQAEEALKEANRRKDEFLATLSHELRNPLAPLLNALEIVRREQNPRAAFEEVRDMMERQVQQLVLLVDDLLDVARISQGKIALREERLELAAIVQSALEMSRPLLEAAKHKLTVQLPPPLYVVGDLTRLAQVLANLLNNAAKYTPEGGQIGLTAERKGDRAVVQVQDNGLGIPIEVMPHIFEMFTQVDRNLQRAQGGLGIGLTLVKRLVEMHGGAVEAFSEGNGKGSTFTVRLPLAPPTGQALRAVQEEVTHEKKNTTYRILVVDDIEDSAQSLAKLLQMTGHEVRTAHDGPSALEAAMSFVPEVVLLDIGLPGMSGYEVARRLRALPGLQDVVLVAQTGWGQEVDRHHSREAGFNHHLTKPIDFGVLCNYLASLDTT